ncbi:MAG: excinuclease ABC subunit UvrA, partial [Candidatus Eisenbacteria bacterium]|nr:excinuclease ABC subunit UvrA [Candidatus Eisenbacteria bacterium]
MKKLTIRSAREHNLKSVDVDIPHDSLVVITGVSGSGKSSLAFDTIYREGQRRYLSSLSSYARQYLGKLGKPDFERIDGLSPAISLDQKTVVRNPRSTVGTLSGITDILRLLFSRLGDCEPGTSSSSFSFNSPKGACPVCKGLGVEDRIIPDLLVLDNTKTIREGALVLTTPTGYLVYSQVTLDVLNTVCRAHGFSIDIPWKDLTDDQLHVILNGSDKIKIPYGKHPLESRLKWAAFTAKPREEGYYKGILPVMEDILKRDRNNNILRFVRSVKCRGCGGRRLNVDVLKITCFGRNIAALSALTIDELHSYFAQIKLSEKESPIGRPLVEQLLERSGMLRRLRLGYLTVDRESTTLSAGEAQRIRLTSIVGSRLQGILYILDEPSVGLHPVDHQSLLEILKQLRDSGNTVLVVEHDEETMRHADWLIDIGPRAGSLGGEILFEGAPKNIPAKIAASKSETLPYLLGAKQITIPDKVRTGAGEIKILGAGEFNLKNIDVRFKTAAFNVVTGVSGAGKSTLVNRTLAFKLKECAGEAAVKYHHIEGLEQIDKLIEIDQAPIGRTPRSNPATYTKLFDLIRDLFSRQSAAKELGFDKGRFSFNVKGGRCERCQGAGVQQIGMHFLNDVSVTCEECGGKRFDESTLSVLYRGKNIHDVLEMPVEEAARFFVDAERIMHYLDTLLDVGLGYIKLGQPSTTLSGGEAQRIKLAAQLARPATGRTLYILNEPTTGLHSADIVVLLKAINRLIDAGNTVIAIEHNIDFIKSADWAVDLGPGSGKEGGRVVFMGLPMEMADSKESLTGRALKESGSRRPIQEGTDDGKTDGRGRTGAGPKKNMEIRGAAAHNLQSIDVDIPHEKLTVITGVSGSGKSSLAFDTVYAQCRRKFSESLSTQARRYLTKLPTPPVEETLGLNAAIAIQQQRGRDNPRSIIATVTEIYDVYRLLFSRAGMACGTSTDFPAGAFSFNHHLGSCMECRGLGVKIGCSPEALVSHPGRSLLDGALDGSKTGRFYGERGGRYLAILETVGKERGIDYTAPFNALSSEALEIALYGTGATVWNVVWKFNRKGRIGEHAWDTPWLGFCTYVEQEYARVHADHRGEQMLPLMKDILCPTCQGKRLSPEILKVEFAGRNISELCAMTVTGTISFLKDLAAEPAAHSVTNRQMLITEEIRREIAERLEPINQVGLGYLTLDRKTSSLSGGELQRLLLATQLRSGLCRVTYVLDEPTVGLHERDTQKLLGVLKRLRDEGNTVLIVEHDEQVIRSADHIIDMGPGAGSLGGHIVAAGDLPSIESHPNSLTGRYLSGKKKIGRLAKKHALEEGFEIKGAHANNLKNIDVKIPKSCVIAITGVSGSGKSSLAFDVITESFIRNRPVKCQGYEGFDQFARIIGIDQTPIGISPLSNPATYCGLFDKIRELFAQTEPSRNLGYKKGHFSFNSKGGRCEICRGMGHQKIEMGFLSDIWVPCEDCGGQRYNRETLEIRYRNRNIFEVLQTTIDEAKEIFFDSPGLKLPLDILDSVGLGYLTLGQPSNTLSGGEAQRLKLATELIKSTVSRSANNGGDNIYIFDEPTTGLHFQDVDRLVGIFSELAAKGHTVLIVEHNMDIIRNADWIIDLGPEGGDGGGAIVVSG